MSHKFFRMGFWTSALVILCLSVLNCEPLPCAGFEIRVLGQNQWLTGSTANIRVISFNPCGNSPVSGIPVRAVLVQDQREIPLGDGVTGTGGSVELGGKLPEDLSGDAVLKVQAGSDNSPVELTAPISIKPLTRIYLTTDKPLYQPGQSLHLRALALRQPGLQPAAGQVLTFKVEDGKGNLVFKKTLTTSEFGIASGVFVLADEVNQGRFRVSAVMGEAEVEKTVEVKNYVLPKFKIELDTNKTFYLPGEVINGSLKSSYFFGKPVNHADVKLSLAVMEISWVKKAEIEGKTDKDGGFSFSLNLPDYLVGLPLEQGKALIQLKAEITDRAGHQESKILTVPVTPNALQAELFPENGILKPYLENKILLFTSLPDGSPAPARADILISGWSYKTIHTDASGWGEFYLTPKDAETALTLMLSDAQGNRSQQDLKLGAQGGEEQLLIRSAQPVYQVGDVMALNFLATRKHGNLYVDFIVHNQTVLTKIVTLTAGAGSLDLTLTPDCAGILKLNAYCLAPQGDILKATKNIMVRDAQDLKLDIQPAAESYLPGEQAILNFKVLDSYGKPTVAAIGIDVVDEALLALGELQPGMEKVYFMLEHELMEPKYEIHGLGLPDILLQPPQLHNQARDEVLLNKIPGTDFTLTLNSYDAKLKLITERMQAIQAALTAYGSNTGEIAYRDALAILLRTKLLPAEDSKDPWGKEFMVLKPREPWQPAVIISAGPGGIFGDSDDITSEQLPGLRSQELLEDRIFMAAPMAGIDGIKAKGANEAAAGALIGSAAPVLKVREYFPETLYTNPEIITDTLGLATLTIPLADSITTWRIAATASSLQGAMGNKTLPLRVFQDFFVDLDLPVNLTQNDEISLPAVVYNYLPHSQKVNLKLEAADWFTLLSPGNLEISLDKDAVKAVYFRIKVKALGLHKLTLYGYGSKMQDAIRRSIEVLPDGEPCQFTSSNLISDNCSAAVHIPGEALSGASKILVTIYPGILSQVVDGLDKILRMPFGCFEQTSATTYPNALVLKYLQKVNKTSPELRLKAESYLNTGYQRLLSFEVAGGGFSWFGDAPANKILSAFGVMEFKDMSKVYTVDPQVITRTQNWLMRQQNADGSWSPDKAYLHQESWSRIQNSSLPVTAYIAWNLLESGLEGKCPDQALQYLCKHWQEVQDSYPLALTANALLAGGNPEAETVLKSLIPHAKIADDTAWWESSMATATFSQGESANLETTALVAYALIKSGVHGNLAQKALNYLIRNKDPEGTWHSTQATILAMKALLLAQDKAGEKVNAEITVRVNGTSKHITLNPENYAVFRQLDFKPQTRNGDNTVSFSFTGQGNSYYQITAKYYLPWKTRKSSPSQGLSLKVNYDRTALEANDLVRAQVALGNRLAREAQMVLVDLGIPPGFTVQSSDLDVLVRDKTIQKYSLTGRQVIIYLEKLPAGQTLTFSYGLRAKYPLKVKTPLSRAYHYYNPEVNAEAAPVFLQVH